LTIIENYLEIYYYIMDFMCICIAMNAGMDDPAPDVESVNLNNISVQEF
jgi:hypothetical protein